MTGNFHVSKSLLQKALKTQTLSWMQLLLASVYSGAFHPTAEGQAAIADAVVDKARSVLAKYERGGDERGVRSQAGAGGARASSPECDPAFNLPGANPC